MQELEIITENPDVLGSVEVAASVTVLLTTTEEVGGNRTVCAISLSFGGVMNFIVFYARKVDRGFF